MNHLKQIAAKLPEYGVDAMMLTSAPGEFYAVGFHGEGIVLVAAGEAYYFTDSRYIEAAEKQVAGAAVAVTDRNRNYKAMVQEVIDRCGIKKLGFGLMRLPMIGDDVDIEQTKQMVDLFLSKGFTYFDTAYGYLNGKSEKAIKAALVDRYPRECYQLATKLPAWAGAKTAEEARAMLATSLERTGAGYFDFYLMHNLGDNRTEAFDRFGIWDFLAEQKAKGVIKHLGFSFHDKADVLDDLLNKHPDMEFVQLQINYADWESVSIQSRACYCLLYTSDAADEL